MKGLLFAFAAFVFSLGMVFGTIESRRPPPNPVTLRGGYRVVEADFHAHTRFSDGVNSPFDLPLLAEQRGLDVLAVTEHNNVFPGKMARWFSETIGGPLILVGEEVTTKAFHVHGIGLEEKVDPNQPLAKILDDIHAQGGISIAAHPVRRYHAVYEPVLGELDGTEVMHPLAYRSAGFRFEDLRLFYEHAHEEGYPIAAIGSSDYHFFSPLGVVRTLVFVDAERALDAEVVLDAVRAGRTVVYDLEGHAYGDPDLAALLEEEPLQARDHDYGYAGRSALDRFARALGLLGLVAMILFRPSAWARVVRRR